MADVAEPVSGQKRGPGRPPKGTPPVAKKRKLSNATIIPFTPVLSSASTPTAHTPSSKLLSRSSDLKPLPTLSSTQSASLADDTHQSLAASGILALSLARSQAAWTSSGILERYWTKPETGKNARPPPPNNPDIKWMKHKGECRVRIEPHIFECQMYIEEKPRPAAPIPRPPQGAYAGGTYGQVYRPQQQPQYGTPYQAPLAPQTAARTLPPLIAAPQRTPTPQQSRPPAVGANGKANPDPVISKLAARASSDPELKVLMKGVAAGNATQEQLKVFQRHIDELQAQIKAEKERQMEEEEEVKRKQEADAAAAAQVKQEEEAIRYDGPHSNASSSRTGTPQPPTTTNPYYTPQQPQPVQYAAPQQQQHVWTPPVQAAYTPSPTDKAVILAFSVPGAAEDRFLFPQHSILESLSANHMLASFIITRKANDAADPAGLEAGKEYWQPVTIMIEVKLGLEELLTFVRRWVKPADEVRAHMKAIMGRCTKAPERFLALRLPLKGGADKDGEVSAGPSGTVTKESTPVIVVDAKKNIKYVKKAPPPALKKTSGSSGSATPAKAARRESVSAGVKANAETPKPADGGVKAEGAVEGGEQAEGGRPRRAVRKSVRISEG